MADIQTFRPLIDPFGRSISYLRISVTDRCDLRCQYCMSQNMTFLPRQDLLTLEELDRAATAFIMRGTRKLRITGGEPLVRRDIMELFRGLGRHLRSGLLDELTLTTNGTQLARFAGDLRDAGVRRVNVSLDSLNPETFRQVTRGGDIARVHAGLAAARDAGFAVKINTVALRGINDHEIDSLITWCGDAGFDLTLIETMPLGDTGIDRNEYYLPLSLLRTDLERRWTLVPSEHRSGGPARYVTVAETGRKLGFITPLSHNFCDSCNRVRLTCTGILYMCLGQDAAADLRRVLRSGADDRALQAAIDEAIARKPQGHDFVINRRSRQPAVMRHMSVTGG